MTARHQKTRLSMGSGMFLSVLVVVALSALALWPRRTWSPPARPGIRAPVVFDEFVNPPQPAAAPEASSAVR